MRPRFHLAFPVHDIAQARGFYVDVLGARVGRIDSANEPRWIDFDFFGHQLSAHLADAADARDAHNSVDGDQVPCRHFGVILEMPAWEELAKRLEAKQQPFLIAPRLRFVGEAGEQATFFILDPSGNALEFKAFADDAQVFDPG